MDERINHNIYTGNFGNGDALVSIISFSMLLIIIFIAKMYMHITINKNEDGEPRIKYNIELQYTSVHMYQNWACIISCICGYNNIAQ